MPRLKAAPPRLKAAPPRLASTPQPGERGRDAARREAERRGENLRKLYRTARWRRTRLEVLTRDGWHCRQTGVILTDAPNLPNSAIVDHIRKPEGNLALFWDLDNLQAVAKAWHDSDKQRLERGMGIPMMLTNPSADRGVGQKSGGG